MVEDDSVMEGSSGQRMTSGRSDVTKANFEKAECHNASSWTLGVVNFSEKILDSQGTCHHPHHPDEDQIFTTTIIQIN